MSGTKKCANCETEKRLADGWRKNVDYVYGTFQHETAARILEELRRILEAYPANYPEG